jgi:hypothetical protein
MPGVTAGASFGVYRLFALQRLTCRSCLDGDLRDVPARVEGGLLGYSLPLYAWAQAAVSVGYLPFAIGGRDR